MGTKDSLKVLVCTLMAKSLLLNLAGLKLLFYSLQINRLSVFSPAVLTKITISIALTPG